VKIIKTYFPNLTDQQIKQLEKLQDLYTDWNDKINVISRKDIGNLYLHHVLHSIAIAKFIHFTAGSKVIDVGTGGGFPGIPLAILFPEVDFLLLDSIGKKIKVAENIALEIGLTNVEVTHSRVENEKRIFHFVVSRAVMPLPDLVKLSRKNISKDQINSIPNGIICLKGGNLTAETEPFKKIAEQVPLTNYFKEPFFETKKLVYIPIN
jgi:16S rRNA (guanine527-N7)-methyltransferase